MPKPRKSPRPFDPFGDVLRWKETARFTPTVEEELRRVEAAEKKILRRGGQQLWLEHIERYFPTKVPAAVSADDRALELGGADLVKRFRTLRRKGVPEAGRQMALDSLEPLVWRRRRLKEEARQVTVLSDLRPALERWLRQGWPLVRRRLVTPEEIHPVLRDIMWQLVLAVSSALFRLEVLKVGPARRKPEHALPRPKPGSVRMDIDGDKVEGDLYHLFKSTAHHQDEREAQLRSLREDAAVIVRLLHLRRVRES